MILLLSTAHAVTPDAARIEADLHALTSLTSRHVRHADHALALDYLREQLDAIDGLTVWEEPFEDDSYGTLTNLVAELPGQTDTPVLIGAHYDSTASAESGYQPADDPAPGADDDASGVAAVLEVARLLSGQALHHPVRFVLFDGEEVGLLGSSYHAEQLDDLRMALILDPVGYNPGDVLFFTFQEQWEAEAEAFAATATDLTVYGVEETTIGGDARSDHWPLWQAGLPALHAGTFPQPPSYHTAADTEDVVDLVFLTEVTRICAEHIATLAEPAEAEEEPASGGCATLPSAAGRWLVLVLLATWSRRRP